MTARFDDDRTQWEPGKDVAIEPECHACMDSGIVEECDNDRVRMVPCDGCAAGDRRKGEARADYEAMKSHLAWVERLGARVAEVDAATRGQSLGVVDWFPIQQVIETLDKLVQVRATTMQLLDQINGSSDLLRGSGDANETATAVRVKSRGSGVRMQALQKKIADFASDMLAIKAEIVCKFFAPETIVARSNIERTPDAPNAMEAIALLKDEFSSYRIKVAPEALAMTDFDAVKQERGDFMKGVVEFMTAAAPLVQQAPKIAPLLLSCLKHFVAGYKGAAILEGEVDRMISTAQKDLAAAAANPQGPGQDPQLALERQKAQLKMQVDAQKAKADADNDQRQAALDKQRNQDELQQHAQEAQIDSEFQIKELEAKAQMQREQNAEKERMRLARPVKPGLTPSA